MNFIRPLMPGALVSILRESEDAFDRISHLYHVYFARMANSGAWNASHLPYEERQASAQDAENDRVNLQRDVTRIKTFCYGPLMMLSAEVSTYAIPFITAWGAVIEKQGGLPAVLSLLGVVAARNYLYSQAESLLTDAQIEINELEFKLGYQKTA
ncbi:MAG: hypothetical protein AABX12_05140 [Nanoarchaeota archaeon]